MTVERLAAPMPWFGGKSRVAREVWRRLGDTANYVEPFFGSGAVLLARPDAHRWWRRTETVNDADGMIANFWRAVAADADGVARHADWIIHECDLHARHAWLVERAASVKARLEADPAWCDAQVAGWWLWGICAWIGSGWCSGEGPWRVVDGELVNGNAGQGINRQLPHLGDAGQGINRQLPHLGDAGQGINRQLPHLGDAGRGINRKLPHLGDAGQGHAEAWSEHIRDIMRLLADRLRRVRVCCGDWSRVVTESVTIRHGTTAVFLDPPYAAGDWAAGLYREEADIWGAVRDWAVTHGGDGRYRIALCGYEGVGEVPEGWTEHRWKTPGGYGSQGSGRGMANRTRERVWFSPHCLPEQQPSLFTLAGVTA